VPHTWSLPSPDFSDHFSVIIRVFLNDLGWGDGGVTRLQRELVMQLKPMRRRGAGPDQLRRLPLHQQVTQVCLYLNLSLTLPTPMPTGVKGEGTRTWYAGLGNLS
jgi:hypothetical protein